MTAPPRPQRRRETIRVAAAERRAARRHRQPPRLPHLRTAGRLLIGSVYPLWWSFVVASGTNATRGETLPLDPRAATSSPTPPRCSTHPVLAGAAATSFIISGIITISVVTFSTLAGYAFAKLRFRGRDGLMIFVIATMAIPTQLGIIPLFIVMRELGWTGTLGAVIVPTLVTAFGVFFMRQYLVDVIPDELIEAARDRRREPVPHLPDRRLPRRPPGHGDPRPLHLHDGVDRLPLAAHRAEPAEPDAADGAQPAAVGLLRRLLDRAGRRRARDPSAAGALRRSRGAS